MILIGKQGLAGGGNCYTSASGSKPNRNSEAPIMRKPSVGSIRPSLDFTNQDIANRTQNEEDLILPEINFRHDAKQEEKLLVLIDEVYAAFKEGIIEGELIESMEKIGLPGTVKLYEIGGRLLELLTKSVIYK